MRRMLIVVTLLGSSLTYAEDPAPVVAPPAAPATPAAPLVATVEAPAVVVTPPPVAAPAAPANAAPTPAAAGNSQSLVLAMDRILPGATEDKIKALLPQETRAVLNLYLAGEIRQWYFRQDRPGVVFVLESGNLDHARELLKDLPLAKAKLVDYDLVPLGPYIPLATLLQNETGKNTRRH